MNELSNMTADEIKGLLQETGEFLAMLTPEQGSKLAFVLDKAVNLMVKGHTEKIGKLLLALAERDRIIKLLDWLV